MANSNATIRTIVRIAIIGGEFDHKEEQRFVGSYSDLDGLNRALRSIRAMNDHDAYCKTDIEFTWSNGEVESRRFDIFGKKAHVDNSSFERIIGQRMQAAREAVAAPHQGLLTTGYTTEGAAQADLDDLREFFTAVCAYKATIVTSAAPESDVDTTIAALHAELATSQDNLQVSEKEADALLEMLQDERKTTVKFEQMRDQLRSLRGLLDAMDLDA